MTTPLSPRAITLLNYMFGDPLFSIFRTFVNDGTVLPTDEIVNPKLGDYLASLQAGSSGVFPSIESLYVPGVPPVTPAVDDDEFDSGILDSSWNLHTTGLSQHAVTWTPANIDEDTVDTGHTFRYQMAAAGNPSALVIQPGATNTDQGGIARKLDSGTTPDNWLMTVGMSFGVERLTGVSPDFQVLIFMANDAPSNGYGDWDYAHFAGILIQGDYTGIEIRGVYQNADPQVTTFANGNPITISSGSEPSEFQLRKKGDLYTVSIKFANGQKLLLMSQDMSGLGLTGPVRYGVAVSSTSTPNMIIPINYIRHRFNASDF